MGLGISTGDDDAGVRHAGSLGWLCVCVIDSNEWCKYRPELSLACPLMTDLRGLLGPGRDKTRKKGLCIMERRNATRGADSLLGRTRGKVMLTNCTFGKIML